MRHGLYRMAWSSNPMEASPLDLRRGTVLPRAPLDVSPDPLWGDDDNKQQQQQQQQQLLYLNATVFIHDELLHADKASSPN